MSGRGAATHLAIALALVVGVLCPTASAEVVGPPILPASGALFGAYVRVDPSRTGPTRPTAIAAVENEIGRALALDREYYLWNQSWPTADDTASVAAGRTLYLSWSARRTDGTHVSWIDIANGVFDGTIDRQAAAISALGAPVFFSFNHEPENDGVSGTPADFVAAFRHIEDRFDVDGVTNVSYAWTMMAWSFRQGIAGRYYPGDAYADVIAADGYTWYGCNNPSGPWRTFTEVFQPFYAFGRTRGKPMMIAEWGATEDLAKPGRKATWIDEASTQLKQWPQIKGVMYFNTDNGCPRWVDSSAASLAAFSAMGADPYFNPPPSLTISSGPPIWTANTSATMTFSGNDPAGVGFRCSLDGGAAKGCQGGGTSYSGIALGDHVFSVWQVDGSDARVGGVARWSWTVIQRPPINVADAGFSPATAYSTQGAPVLWAASGARDHTVTDASGMGLFDSGSLSAGSTFTFTFAAAGAYTYRSTLDSGMNGTVKIPIVVQPAVGSASTAFGIGWASEAPPAGYVYDVQIQRPGSTWKKWSSFWGTVATSGMFTPDVGAGTYSFRARMRLPSIARQSGWCAAKTATVS